MSSLQELEKRYDLTLPISYVNWFNGGGQKCQNLVGTDVDYPRLSELQEWAQEILEEDKSSFVLPEKSFVFLMHQGYQFMYFICDGCEDPEVWYYLEGDLEPKIKWKCFSEYIRELE